MRRSGAVQVVSPFATLLSVEVHTLGFSNRTWDETVRLLEGFGILRLVDIRTLPGSKHTPQFNQEHLKLALPRAGIEYLHCKQLGGFRKPSRDDDSKAGWKNPSFRGYADYMQTPQFEAAISDLITWISGMRTAYACTEAVYWRCHRSLVSDALTARGIAVFHILGPGKAEEHKLTTFARVEGVRVTYPEETLWNPRAR
jgi:uncharacterized protein (DUF488 family)